MSQDSDPPVEIYDSARTHGVADEDILHALKFQQYIGDEENTENDLPESLVLGPDRAGNLLELAVLTTADGPLIIHAMPMRPQFAHLLPGRKRRR